jgi:hypothetical protein
MLSRFFSKKGKRNFGWRRLRIFDIQEYQEYGETDLRSAMTSDFDGLGKQRGLAGERRYLRR